MPIGETKQGPTEMHVFVFVFFVKRSCILEMTEHRLRRCHKESRPQPVYINSVVISASHINQS